MSDPHRPNVCLAWYYHLPWVSDDAEVDDLVRESLAPLLAAHKTFAAPMVLAITGVLLERLARRHRPLIQAIADLAEQGLIELAATFHHEVLPPILSPIELDQHIVADLRTKRRVFGHHPTVFLPGNFTWVASLATLLARHGMKRVILDGAHLHRATSIQRWRWSVQAATTVTESLVPIGLQPDALRQHYRLRGSHNGGDLDLFFRDTDVVFAVSAGHRGAIQQPLDPTALPSAVALLEAGSGTVVLADDGDRINALSAFSYRRFLESIGAGRLVTSAIATTGPHRTLDYLPGYVIADLQRFWLGDPDATHWLAVLDEIRRRHPAVEDPDEILRLHDVYPLFWRNHWRCRLFWQAAMRLIDSGDVTTPQPP